MVRLLFTPRAVADLEAIHDYIARESLERADATIDRVRERSRILRKWPELGRQRAELGRGVRSFPVGPLIVLYRLGGDDIEIVRVIDGRRDVAAAFFSNLVLLGVA